MTPEQFDTIEARYTNGEGLEAIIADLGLDSDATIEEIKTSTDYLNRIFIAKNTARHAS